MIDLRSIANSVIQDVNPNITATWQQSTGGYTTDAAGHRTATTAATTVEIQAQALAGDALKQIDGLNIQGVMRNVRMSGNLQGAIRADQRGGDTLAFPEFPGGAVKSWRVVHVLETWPTWCSVVVVLQ